MLMMDLGIRIKSLAFYSSQKFWKTIFDDYYAIQLFLICTKSNDRGFGFSALFANDG